MNTLLTMNDDIDRFFNESRYTTASEAGYRYHLNRFAQYANDIGLNMESLTVGMLNKYLRSQNWKNNTQRQAGNAVKSFVRWKYGEQHPVSNIKLPKDNSKKGRFLTSAQLADLISTFDMSKPVGWRNISIIALMVETGIRVSEVCRLDLNDLNLSARHFDVLAKGGEWREGVFSEITAECLDKWLDVRRLYARKGCSKVFVSVNGKTKGAPLTRDGLRSNFRKYGMRTDSIKKLSPHDLRRSMAMLLTLGKTPTRTVQELGHWRDSRMVDRYTRNLNPDLISQYSPLVLYGIDQLISNSLAH